MVDGTKDNSIDNDLLDSKVYDKVNELEPIDGEDFLKELSELQETIKSVAKDKIQKRKSTDTSNILDNNKQVDEEYDALISDAYGEQVQGKISEDKETKVSEFFKKGEKEFAKIDTEIEKEIIGGYKTIKGNIRGRSEGVKQAIEKSVDNILDEIYNWKEEKNPVARSLLRIVNMIMKTEK